MTRVVLPLLVALSALSCASSRQYDFPAAKPAAPRSGVTVAISQQQPLTDALVRRATEAGYSVLDVTRYKAAFDRQAPASWVLWTAPGTRKRISISFAPGRDSVFVSGKIEAVEPRGQVLKTGSGKDRREVEELLDAAAADLEKH